MSMRDVAYEQAVQRARRFPDMAIHSEPQADLPPRDAALLRAIDHAVTRRWLTLRAVCSHWMRDPWPQTRPEVQAALLVGAAELLLLDREADHAAINEAVGWTRRRVRGKVSGMINAVLRRVADARRDRVVRGDTNVLLPPNDIDPCCWLPLSDGRGWHLAEPIFSADPSDRLSEQASLSPAVIAHWTRTYGRPTTLDLAAHSLTTAPIIVTGADFSDVADCAPHRASGFWVYTGTVSALPALLADRPGGRVQDPAAARAAEATRGLRCQRIVDYCAGRGTKTMQLAQVHPQAEVIATDVDDIRRAELSRVFADHPRVHVKAPDDLDDIRGTADLLVLDVPCSNTGVLARRLEARYRFHEKSLATLVTLQRQVVADAITLLNDDGHMLYTTCSLDPAENDQQVRHITKLHRMTIETEDTVMPAGGPGRPQTEYRDGSYAALLRVDG